MFFATAFFCGYTIISKVFIKEGKDSRSLDTLLWVMVLGTLLGARLGHCFFYEPDYYLAKPWRIVEVWKGGLASHGALVGICLSLWAYSRYHQDQPYLWLLDRMSLTVPLGGAFIRLGNFFNSEILGRPTDLPWGVVFSRIGGDALHPVQLYESLSYLIIFFIMRRSYQKLGADAGRGYYVGMMLMLVFSARFILEYFKQPQSHFGMVQILTMGQLLSIPSVFLGVYFFNRSFKSFSR